MGVLVMVLAPASAKCMSINTKAIVSLETMPFGVLLLFPLQAKIKRLKSNKNANAC
jgi:hypothetical protein